MACKKYEYNKKNINEGQTYYRSSEVSEMQNKGIIKLSKVKFKKEMNELSKA